MLYIFASTIFIILFGEDISNEMIEVYDESVDKDTRVPISRVLSLLGKNILKKQNIAIRLFSDMLNNVALTQEERRALRDCNRLRDHVLGIIRDRKSGKRKS